MQPDHAPFPVPPPTMAHVEVEVLRAELARARDEIAFLRSLVTRVGQVA